MKKESSQERRTRGTEEIEEMGKRRDEEIHMQGPLVGMSHRRSKCRQVSSLLQCYKCVFFFRHRELFYPVDHFIGVGNSGKIQERLRRLEGGTLKLSLSWTSISLSRNLWTLPRANGGKFEWGTGVEEKARFAKARGGSWAGSLTTSVSTHQCEHLPVFKKCWAKVEHHQQCGFLPRCCLQGPF